MYHSHVYIHTHKPYGSLENGGHVHGFNVSKLILKKATCNKVVEGVDPKTTPGGRVTKGTQFNTVDDSEISGELTTLRITGPSNGRV